MPSPLDFIQTLSQKVLAGSKNELGTKTATDESNTSKADAFSSAFNQALRSKLDKAEKSSTVSSEQPAEAFNTLNGEKTATDKIGQPDNVDKKTEEEVTVELAMAEGMTNRLPLINEPEPPSQTSAFSGVISQTEALPQSGQSEEKTERKESTATLAQSVCFSTLSPEALIMMGLPAEFQVQNTQSTLASTSTTEIDTASQGIMDIETSSSPTKLTDPLSDSVNSIQTNFGLPQPIPVSADTQGPGFDKALQSALPGLNLTQNQVENVAQTSTTVDTLPSALPTALELPEGPGTIEFNPLLNQTSAPNLPLTPDVPTNKSNTETIEPATSPLTTSSSKTAQEAQTVLPSAVSTPSPEMGSEAQTVLPPTISVPSPEMGPEAQTVLPPTVSVPSPEMGSEAQTVMPPTFNTPPANRTTESVTNAKQTTTNTKIDTKGKIKELLKPITDFEASLSAFNGEIESQHQSPDQDTENSTAFSKDALPEISDKAPGSSDPLTPVSFSSNLATPAGITESTAANTSGKLPNFASLASNPLDQVVDGTVYSVKNGHKELILKINPDNLGEVRIRLTSHGNNEMSARLIASTQEGHELLKTQAETLKASLEAQGIHIEKLSVMLAGHTDNGTNPNKQEQSSDFQQQPSSQPQTQQQTFQQSNQSFNPFFQANNGAYQNKQGFAQNPGSTNYGTGNGREEHSGGSAEPVSRRNDNGNVSVLA